MLVSVLGDAERLRYISDKMKPLNIDLTFILNKRKSHRTTRKSHGSPKKATLSGAERARLFRLRKKADKDYVAKNKVKCAAYHQRVRDRRIADEDYDKEQQEYERVRKSAQRAKKRRWQRLLDHTY